MPTPATIERRRKAAEKALDKQIEAIYYRRCSGIRINIMDISKVFKAGREAAHAGEDIEAAIVACVDAIRKN